MSPGHSPLHDLERLEHIAETMQKRTAPERVSDDLTKLKMLRVQEGTNPMWTRSYLASVTSLFEAAGQDTILKGLVRTLHRHDKTRQFFGKEPLEFTVQTMRIIGQYLQEQGTIMPFENSAVDDIGTGHVRATRLLTKLRDTSIRPAVLRALSGQPDQQKLATAKEGIQQMCTYLKQQYFQASIIIADVFSALPRGLLQHVRHALSGVLSQVQQLDIRSHTRFIAADTKKDDSDRMRIDSAKDFWALFYATMVRSPNEEETRRILHVLLATKLTVISLGDALADQNIWNSAQYPAS